MTAILKMFLIFYVQSLFLLFFLDGVGAMVGSAVVGGMILAMIEGMGILFTRMTADQFRPMGPPMEDPPSANAPSPFSSNNQQHYH